MTRIADQRRQEILKAAAACFTRHGFHKTSVADICAAAEMSPGSLYRYFRSKEEMIRAMVDEDRKESAEIIARLADQPELIPALIQAYQEVAASMKDPQSLAMHAEVSAEALRSPEIAEVVRGNDRATLAALTAVLIQAQARGEMSQHLDAGLTAELLVALVDGLTWGQALHPHPDPARFTPLLAELLQGFLRPQPGPSSQSASASPLTLVSHSEGKPTKPVTNHGEEL